MNRKILNKFAAQLILTFIPLFFLSVSVTLGQNEKGSAGVKSATAGMTKKKTIPEFWVQGIITSSNGKPVGNALITANEGAIVLRSDEKGYFKVRSSIGSFILIEAKGFEPLAYEVRKEEKNLTLVLEVAPLYAGTLDNVDVLMGVKEKQRYLVGAVSGVSGEALMYFPEPLLSNTLQGQILGLYAQMGSSGLGNNSASLFIRGHHRNGGNNIVTIVDGVERNIDALLLDEIASVQVMKDATSKILYGARAANGVLSVTTRRGKMHTRKINVKVETGAGMPVAYPKYLNSYEYATLYNEARLNDGLPPMYSTADLEGYRNSKGPNDVRYPDVDYIDYFLSKTSGYRKVGLEFSGGNENAQYSFIAGYNGNTGLQKVGDAPTRDWYNVRGNLDMKITDFFKAFVGIAGVFDVKRRSGTLDHSGTFGLIRDTRPNEFPLVIDPIYVPIDTLGFPGLGASYAQGSNLYGELKYGGRVRENDVNGELNLGLVFDLSSLVKGLSLKAQLGFDNYFRGNERVNVNIATYAQRWYYDQVLRKDTVLFQQLNKTTITDQNTLNSSWNLRTNAYLLGADFERVFNHDHRISSNLLYHYMMMEETGTTPNLQTANTVLRTNYSFKDKYIAELNLALMGSDKFQNNNRFFMSWAGGLGWLISDEDFLKSVKSIDYLKVKASGGLLGYDAQTDWNLYYNRWRDNGSYTFRSNNSTGRVTFANFASPNLKWEKSLEFNLGTEGLLLNRKLWVEANYFHETRSDVITDASSFYSSIYGGLYGQINRGKVRNQGFEFEAKYMNKVSDFLYSIGLNGIYSKNKLLVSNEIEHTEEYRRSTGKPTDAMFGYVDKGLFRTPADLVNAPHQTLGYYTIGDIAYEDLNKDGVVDENDRRMVGNSYPRMNLGMSMDFSYKGFALNLLGVSSLGVNSWLTNNYFWNFGERKWSDQALNRFHPINNPEGTYPRLTTTQGSNNFENSTFWLANTSFFRLKNAELSYTFGYNKPISTRLKTIKVFTRGMNILTISKIKELDPEVLGAGVNNYPLFSTYTVGVSVMF